MSYFAFGFVELTRETEGTKSGVTVGMTRCAAALGIALQGDGEPSILGEMRGDFSENSAIPFLCLAHAEDDASDGLISPHLVGIGAASAGLQRIADWVACVLRAESVQRVRIWFTEGFDDAFEQRECRAEELGPLLIARLIEENDVPSMLLCVR